MPGARTARLARVAAGRSVLSELTLYYSPRACSLACHIALEESGLPFTAVPVRIRRGEHREADYLAVNPWGKLPSLRADGRVLTETPAILSLIADLAEREPPLMPQGDAHARALALEWLSFAASTVHLAFRPFFRPYVYIDDETQHAAVRRAALPGYRAVLAEVDRRIGDGPWALGEDYSVCDPYLYVFHVWSRREDMAELAPDTPNWDAHRARMDERPATLRALATEGLDGPGLTAP